MIEVKVKDNNGEKAMRKLKKKLDKEGLMWELKLRKFYEKPTLKRQRKKKESIARVAKEKRKRDAFGF